MIYTAGRGFCFPSSSTVPWSPSLSSSTDRAAEGPHPEPCPSSDVSQGMAPHGTPRPWKHQHSSCPAGSSPASCWPLSSDPLGDKMTCHFLAIVFRAPWGQNAALAGHRAILGGSFGSCQCPSCPSSLNAHPSPHELCPLPHRLL